MNAEALLKRLIVHGLYFDEGLMWVWKENVTVGENDAALERDLITFIKDNRLELKITGGDDIP